MGFARAQIFCDNITCVTYSLLLWLAVTVAGVSQTVDDFNPDPRAEATATAVSLNLQPDGHILFAEKFYRLGTNYSVEGICRLTPDGSVETQFKPDPSNEVFCTALQLDGKILLGGTFTNIAGQRQKFMARLNSDGSLDPSFNPSPNTNVYCIVVQPDGKILVGGIFTNIAGQACSGLTRLNPDGSSDPDFNAPILSGYPPPLGVGGVIVQPDGNVLISGSFRSINGQTRNYLARLNSDGTLDSSFTASAGSSGIRGWALQPDGKLLVCDPAVGGRVLRLAANGSTDNGFIDTISGTYPYFVNAISVQTDGKILIGGEFSGVDNTARTALARLFPDGSLDTNFNANLSPSGSAVSALLQQPDGRILLAGGFINVEGQTRFGLARLINTDPETDNLSFDGSTITWARSGGGPAVLRTSFDVLSNSVWIPLGAGEPISGGWQLGGLSLPADSTIRARGFGAGGGSDSAVAYVIQSTGDVRITCQPTNQTIDARSTATLSVTGVGSGPISYQWQKNGMSLSDIDNLSGATTPTLSISNVLAPDSGGYTVVLSNSFGTVTSSVATLTVVDPAILTPPLTQATPAGQPATLMVNAAGTEPLQFQWRKDGIEISGATASSLTITNPQPPDAGNYDVIVSNSAGTNTSPYATLTVNTLDDDLNPGVAGTVYTTVIQPDGKIILGGSFNSVGGFSHTNICRLNADGTVDNTFNPSFNSSVYCLGIQEDAKILVGGEFYSPRNFLARLNPNGSLDQTFQPPLSGSHAYCLAVQSDGKILVGGDFYYNEPNPPHRAWRLLARLRQDGSVDGTFYPNIQTTTTQPEVTSILIEPSDMILISGNIGKINNQYVGSLVRLFPDGTLDSDFTPEIFEGGEDQGGAQAPPSRCVVQLTNRKLLVSASRVAAGPLGPAGYTDPIWTNLARLNGDGSTDTSFPQDAFGGPASISLQADGKILFSAGMTPDSGFIRRGLTRLNADITPDDIFNPGAGLTVYSLAIQKDGRIIAAGNFTSLDGQARAGIGRLNNTEPTTEHLSFDGASITWLRGGSSPEVSRVTFEGNTGDDKWFKIGDAQRIDGAWYLPLPGAERFASIRARGWIQCGYCNGSFYFVESVLQVIPRITVQPGFGADSNQFALTLTGTPGSEAVVEASTNLLDWTPVSTNTFETNTLQFTDPAISGFSRRFYRARVP